MSAIRRGILHPQYITEYRKSTFILDTEIDAVRSVRISPSEELIKIVKKRSFKV